MVSVGNFNQVQSDLAISPSTMENNTEQDSFRVEFAIDSPETVDESEFSLRLASGDTTIAPIAAPGDCDGAVEGTGTCEMAFSKDDFVPLLDGTGNYTLVLEGEWESEREFATRGTVEIVEEVHTVDTTDDTLTTAGNTDTDDDSTVDTAGNTDADGAGNTGTCAGNTDCTDSTSIVAPGSVSPSASVRRSG